MSRFSDKTIAALAVIFAILIGGALPVYVKIGLKQVSPEVFSFLRFVIASAILLPFFLKQKIKINRNLLKVALISIFGTGNIIFFAYGLKLTQASIGQSLYILSPVVVVFLSYLLLKTKIHFGKGLGILIGLIGAVQITLLPVIEKGSPFSGNLIGNLLVIIAILSFSIYLVLSKRYQADFSSIQITMVFSLTTALITLILSIGQLSNLPHQFLTYSGQTIFAIFYVATLGTAGYHLLFQYAVKHGSPTVASTVLYLQPATTILAAAILLGERLTLGFVFGAILAVIGTTAVIKSK